MPARVSPTEAVRAEIDELFGSGRGIAEVLEEVMRLSARLVLQQVLEDEVTAWLGREWNSREEPGRAGLRNGYSDLRVKTTAGPVDLRRPKLRNTAEAFASRLLGRGVVRSEPLEALVISGWVRGLSDRDIEALLAEALGPEAALSRSTASRICARLRDDFEAFRSRDLSGVELDCLFLDGSHFKMHDGSRAEPVLVAYAITTLGRPPLLAVEPGGDESCDAWAGFLADLRARGLRPPLLAVTDGAAGLIGAIDTTMARALRQRCLVHRARNVLATVPAERRDEFKAAFWEMARQGLQGRKKRTRRGLTRADKAADPVPDLLELDFTAERPDQKWCGDFKQVDTAEGPVFLASVEDLYSWRMLGYATSLRHPTAELAEAALNMAAATRGGCVEGVIFHTDKGSQYTSRDFAGACRRLGVTQSMGRVGSALDNACAESFFSTLEHELISRRNWPTRDQARREIANWISGWYNPKRLHSANNMTSPNDCENAQAA